MQKKSTHIKDFLKAKSPEALKLKMLSNSLKYSTYFDYLINHDGQNWFAWFEVDAEYLINNEVKKLIDEEHYSRQKV